MRHLPRSHGRLGLFVFLLFAILALAPTAEARRKVRLFTIGNTVSDLGLAKSTEASSLSPLTEDGAPALERVGYKFDYFGLFWIDLWTWDGHYCLYHESDDLFGSTTIIPLTEDQAWNCLGTEPSKPWFYSFPPLLIALLACIGYKIYRATRKTSYPVQFFEQAYN